MFMMLYKMEGKHLATEPLQELRGSTNQSNLRKLKEELKMTLGPIDITIPNGKWILTTK